MDRLSRKFDTARSLVPAPVVVQTGKSKVGFIAFGSSDFAVTESRDQLRKAAWSGDGLSAHSGVPVFSRGSEFVAAMSVCT